MLLDITVCTKFAQAAMENLRLHVRRYVRTHVRTNGWSGLTWNGMGRYDMEWNVMQWNEWTIGLMNGMLWKWKTISEMDMVMEWHWIDYVNEWKAMESMTNRKVLVTTI